MALPSPFSFPPFSFPAPAYAPRAPLFVFKAGAPDTFTWPAAAACAPAAPSSSDTPGGAPTATLPFAPMAKPSPAPNRQPPVRHSLKKRTCTGLGSFKFATTTQPTQLPAAPPLMESLVEAKEVKKHHLRNVYPSDLAEAVQEWERSGVAFDWHRKNAVSLRGTDPELLESAARRLQTWFDQITAATIVAAQHDAIQVAAARARVTFSSAGPFSAVELAGTTPAIAELLSLTMVPAHAKAAKALREMPLSWTDPWALASGSKKSQLVELDPASVEYQEIAGLMCYSTDSVVGVSRIQNLHLHKRYQLQLSELGGYRRLFHGTSELTAQRIAAEGFDRAFAGSSTGCLYGKGAYFTSSCGLATAYARSSATSGPARLSRSAASPVIDASTAAAAASGNGDSTASSSRTPFDFGFGNAISAANPVAGVGSAAAASGCGSAAGGESAPPFKQQAVVIVADCALGEVFVQGRSDLMDPTAENPNAYTAVDSLLPETARIFVTFRDYMAYPSYLVRLSFLVEEKKA